MAAPLQTGKQTVDLTEGMPRGSRIRREPPPAVRQTVVPDRDERDQRVVVIGVLAFALALVIVIVGLSAAFGWSPRQYTLEM